MPFVRPYVRSDGTPVRGHSRWAPGARRQLTIFALVAVAAVGLGNSNTQAGETSAPRPKPGEGPAATHPIRLDRSADRAAPRMTVPRPTVSYPIEFATPQRKPTPPTPTVSYPIDLSTPDGER
ncbi:hypothetical protein FHS32_006059 [Streptomyces albaduncus]|uniref:Uncharacterized protein n=1 Tax=Streptomyces griseoloalbus TaxID=67303 RepID=A0A7W8FCE0_9ACTN|nr:hypothetical protein [Streptomyces albaduncus]GGV81342.1 hypothetical protein GCM10010294_54800 [Streptomyces griseoloalbus]